MTTDATPAEKYLEVQRSAEFSALRRKLRRFVFPMTIAFFVWYALYVLLSAYARGFMSLKLVGNINVALLFGLLQFVSTFLIAWFYARYAARELDPIADKIGNELAGTTVPSARKPEDTTTDSEAAK
ncbi:DUF485 domain-containing protein [Actinoplanes sp. NPDC051859]|uniref:DUF485 domain-containing protein n=1 Tax=Actinoplanes sp. NPDC051859 TaxID=3363909 RepID=UPI0037913AFF